MLPSLKNQITRIIEETIDDTIKELFKISLFRLGIHGDD